MRAREHIRSTVMPGDGLSGLAVARSPDLRRYPRGHLLSRARWLYPIIVVALWGTSILLARWTYGAAMEIGGTMPTVAVLQPILFGLTAWPVLRAFLRNRRWFTIANSVLVLAYLYMGVGSAIYIFTYDAIALPVLRNAPYGGAAMQLVILGVMAYRLGAEVPWAARLTARLPQLPTTPPWNAALRLGVLGGVMITIAVVVTQMVAGSYGYGSEANRGNAGIYSVMQGAAALGNIALATSCYYWVTGHRLRARDKGLVVTLGLVLLGFALLNGMKEAAIAVVIFVAVPYLACGGRPRLRWVAATAAGLMVLFALNPLYRNVLRNQAAGGSYATNALVAMQRTAGVAGKRDGVLERGAVQFANRIALFGDLTAAIAQTPRPYPFREWGRYPSLVLIPLVPRLVWATKPQATGGEEFNRRYIIDTENARTPTTFGWAYLEDGYVAVIVLMGTLGALAQLVQRYALDRNGTRLAGVLVFTVGFRVLFQVEGDPYWILAGLGKELVTLVLAYAALVQLPVTLLRPALRRAPAPWKAMP